MITVFDSSNYAQQVFLNEAYAHLKSIGGRLSAAEIAAGKFLSLDGYFAHIADLVSIQPSYVLIPSDEAPFEIDANSRTIKVPSAFNKCAGVVGDNMCEVITFTIDRYFDYTDLANASICVQWQAGEDQGVSHIGIKDLITTPGKIRFGWPLTNALTKKAGNIVFAVRFYVEKTYDNSTGEEVDSLTADPATTTKKFVYLFNTLPATIPIREGLNVMGQEGIQVEQGVDGLFTRFISNSANPSYAMPNPVNYIDNLPDQTKINKDTNTLLLKAQATTKGSGWIDYKWFFKAGAIPTESLETPSVELNKDVIDSWYEIYEEYSPIEEVSDYSKLPKNKQYYYEDNSSKMVNINDKGEFLDVEGNVLKDTQLYERFSCLTIKDTDYKGITGLYYIEARNTVGIDTIENVAYNVEVLDEETGAKKEAKVSYTVQGINSTPWLSSVECYLPVPQEIKIDSAKNLPESKFLIGSEGAGKTAELTVTPDVDAGNPDRIYSWFKAANKVELEFDADKGEWIKPTVTNNYEQIERKNSEGKDINSPSYEATEEGWYWVNIQSILNRDDKTLDSKICRVVEDVKKPIIKQLIIRPGDNNFNINTNDIVSIYDTDKADSIGFNELGINENYDQLIEGMNLTPGSTVELEVVLDEQFKSRLKSDEITYKWYYVNTEGTTYEIVDEKDLVDVTKQMSPSLSGGAIAQIWDNKIESVNNPKLRARIIVSDPSDNKSVYARFYCLVENKLNNKINALTFKDYIDGQTLKMPTFDIY